MKDEISDRIAACESFDDAKTVIDDYMDYYNNDRGQWQLAKLTPNEYYDYCMTGIYPPLISYNNQEPPTLHSPAYTKGCNAHEEENL